MNPPNWIPAELRHHYIPAVPKGASVVSGPYVRSEAWMLKREVAGTKLAIAPMSIGVGTYRLSGK